MRAVRGTVLFGEKVECRLRATFGTVLANWRGALNSGNCRNSVFADKGLLEVFSIIAA